MARVLYLRIPGLWTFTTATKEQDAVYLARRGQEAYARDRGDPGDPENVRRLSIGLSRVVRAVSRQFKRQQKISYRTSRKARELAEFYGTAFPVRARPGAKLRLRVKEIGEEGGRLHAHVASDFDFILQPWLCDIALRCGLGFCQDSRKDSRVPRAAARFSGRRERAQTIALYLSKYLGKPTDDEKPWPWPQHTRLVSGAIGELPQLESARDCLITWKSVRLVAIEEFGASESDFLDRETGELPFAELLGAFCGRDSGAPATGVDHRSLNLKHQVRRARAQLESLAHLPDFRRCHPGP